MCDGSEVEVAVVGGVARNGLTDILEAAKRASTSRCCDWLIATLGAFIGTVSSIRFGLVRRGRSVGVGDFLTDMSIGSEGRVVFNDLLAFILVLCLAVSLAFSSAATEDLVRTGLAEMIGTGADWEAAEDGDGLDEGCDNGAGEEAIAVVFVDNGDAGGVGLVELNLWSPILVGVVLGTGVPGALCSVDSGLLMLSCFFHFVRRFWNQIFTCKYKLYLFIIQSKIVFIIVMWRTLEKHFQYANMHHNSHHNCILI